jgi:hypothetical protein
MFESDVTQGVIHRGVKGRRDFSPAPSRGAGRPEGQNLGALVAPCGLLLLLKEKELIKNFLYMLSRGLYHTLGYEREIRLLLVAPWWHEAKDDFFGKDVPFGPGCEF